MIKHLIIGFLLVGVALHGQTMFSAKDILLPPTTSNLTAMWGNVIPVAEVTLDPHGEWVHAIGTSIDKISISETQIVLECSRQVWEQRGDDYGPFGTFRWKEIYTVQCGKIILLKIIKPKITPAQPEKIEWPQ